MILNDSFNKQAILDWESRFRANFFHAALGVKPAVLIGTIDENSNANLAIFSSAFHLGSNPPIFGFMMRPPDVRRDTLNNILKAGEYSLSIFQSDAIDQAHQTSAKYEPHIDEFDAVGLDKVIWEGVPIPKDSPLSMKLQFLEAIDIHHNKTQLILGEVVAVYANALQLTDDGLILHEENNIVGVSGLDTYYTSKKVKRLSYARPNENPKTL
ncbi:MAG: flavin reductase family protein [Schleiferiaceae bacterium]|nr:flavin reductase family protein [Schleiferiaceae bacterium]